MDNPAGSPPALARSLGELRERHVALLALWRSELDDWEKANRAAALRSGAVALGTWLEDDDERFTAQGIIDYWTAASEGLAGQAAPAPAALAPFDAEAAGNRAAAADVLLDAQENQWRDDAQAVLLRLLRLDQAGRIVERAPIARAELIAGTGRGDAAMDLIDALAAADILRVRLGPSRDEDAVEFGSRGVARRWPRVRQALDERQHVDTIRSRLRATAQLWKQKDGEPGYLLGGASLEAAKQFLGDPAETGVLKEFIEASIARARRNRKRWLFATAIGPTLLLLVVWVVGDLRYERGFHIGEDKGEVNAEKSVQLPQTSIVSAQGPVGYVWIGNADEPLLVDPETREPVSPETVQKNGTYRVNSQFNMNVRAAYPDAENVAASILTVAPSDGLVIAQGVARPVDRPSGRQFWLKVRVVPRIVIRYSGTNVAMIARLEAALRRASFEVPPNQPGDYSGSARVRFSFDQDREIAAAVTRIAATSMTNSTGMPAIATCELLAQEGTLPTIIQVWVDTEHLKHLTSTQDLEKRPCQ